MQMNEWIDSLAELAAAGEPSILVTVAAVRGSAPRDAGAKMIVTATDTIGTIGGGQLEYQCTRDAVALLGAEQAATTHTFPLGSAMGQCCGGVVDILFESIVSGTPAWLDQLCELREQRQAATLLTRLGDNFGKYIVSANDVYGFGTEVLPDSVLELARNLPASQARTERRGEYFLEAVVGSDLNIAVFGAGHVGSELVAVLSRLDCNIRWIDNRRNFFPRAPRNVLAIQAIEPALEVAAMPPGSSFLVMTHSHALDFEICTRILRRSDVSYCGLIGSRSKRRRFEKRFRQQGLSRSAIDSLVCPIGVAGISGKKPAEIAVAATAELLQAHERASTETNQAYPRNVRPLRN